VDQGGGRAMSSKGLLFIGGNGGNDGKQDDASALMAITLR
jgi:hypothetical protein